MNASAAEFHLRRLCEHPPSDSGDDDVRVSPAVAAARALVAIGALSQETVLKLLDGLEDERDPLAASASGPAPFERSRVVATDAAFEPSFGSLRLRYVSLGPNRTELAVTGTIEPARLDVNASLRVGDDAGTTLTTYFAGSERAGELHGAFVPIDGALSPTTRWIEVDGRRVYLEPDVVAPAVWIEAFAERNPALRHLWQLVTPDEWTDAPAPLEVALDALVAVGALGIDHPELAAIRAVSAVMPGAGGVTRELPEPWRSLRDADRSPFDGPEGVLAIGAVTPVFDRFGVAVDALESARDGWSLTVRVAPDHATWTHGWEDPLQLPLRWWAADDRGNTYLGLRGSWTGYGVYGDGDIYFSAPLDPAAAFVDLMPTGPEHRAVIRVPISFA